MQNGWGGDSHPWSGWAVDDLSNNNYYSFLRATMLLGLVAHGERDGIDQWLDVFAPPSWTNSCSRRSSKNSPAAAREGTGYGTSLRSQFELYDISEASTGEALAPKTKHTRASMLAFMHATLPTLDRIAPIGDHARDSTAALFDYHRAYLAELIALFPNDPVAPRAQALLDASTVPEMDPQFMYVYDFLYETPVQTSPVENAGDRVSRARQGSAVHARQLAAERHVAHGSSFLPASSTSGRSGSRSRTRSDTSCASTT